MMTIIDDYHLAKEVEQRLNDNEKPIKVDVDDLLS
jgi:antitoxin StbD